MGHASDELDGLSSFPRICTVGWTCCYRVGARVCNEQSQLMPCSCRQVNIYVIHHSKRHAIFVRNIPECMRSWTKCKGC
jgi:hypothetical protein